MPPVDLGLLTRWCLKSAHRHGPGRLSLGMQIVFQDRVPARVPAVPHLPQQATAFQTPALRRSSR